MRLFLALSMYSESWSQDTTHFANCIALNFGRGGALEPIEAFVLLITAFLHFACLERGGSGLWSQKQKPNNLKSSEGCSVAGSNLRSTILKIIVPGNLGTC